MIIIKLSGGLGNQLFQYSFGKFLAERHNTVLKFDLKLDLKSRGFTQRSLSLSELNLSIEQASKSEIERFVKYSDGILNRIERKWVQFIPIINKRFIVERPFIPIKDSNLIDNCYYDGYWQFQNYPNSIEKILREEIRFDLKISGVNMSILKSIKETESISLHIRRTDYVNEKNNSKIFSVCSIDYYKAAIIFFKKKIKNPVFYFFSDDINWVKQHFNNDTFHFIDNNVNNPSVDLYLMSCCKHHIIANSTFSWWGAWLNEHKNKTVITPSNWYKNIYLNSIATHSLLPENWIKY